MAQTAATPKASNGSIFRAVPHERPDDVESHASQVASKPKMGIRDGAQN